MTEKVEKKLYDRLWSVTQENEIYPSFIQIDGNTLIIGISWGDWKHEHLFLDDLIERSFNAIHVNTKVTESDGSDTYSADHFYTIIDEEDED